MITRYGNIVATPPGATIKEQLELYGMSQKEFSERMGISEKHISNLINGKTRLTPEVSLKLESVLNVPARFWNKLEAIYREKLAKIKELEEIDSEYEIVKAIPYSNMAQLGWVEPTKDNTDRVYRLRSFFSVANLRYIKFSNHSISYRCLKEEKIDDYAIAAWVQKVKIEARKIDTSKIDFNKLRNSLPKLKSMTTKNPKDFSDELVSLMASCGVALVFVSHLKGTFLHGASFYENDRIVIGLTTRGKDADKFWFSLLHEIWHVLLGHIDQNTWNEDRETEADRYASECLIASDDYDKFINGTINKATIAQFSANQGVAPGIVVGRLQKDEIIPYSKFNDLKVKYEITM